MQTAWDRYGENQFSFVLVERCPANEVVKREQALIDQHSPAFNTAKRASKVGSTTLVQLGGENLSLHEIATQFDLPLTTVYSRVRYGWTGDALTQPRKRRGRNSRG